MADETLPLPVVPSIRLRRIKRVVGDAIMSLVLKYLRWRVLRAIVRTVRDPSAKCPACGACHGEIRWAPLMKWPSGEAGALVHQCKTCHAAWGEKPIVAAKEWMIALDEQSQSLFNVNTRA